MNFEKADHNHNFGEDISLDSPDVTAEETLPLDSQGDSIIREVDMDTFADPDKVQENPFELTGDGGVAQVTEQVQDLGEGVQVFEPVEQLDPNSGNADQVIDNTNKFSAEISPNESYPDRVIDNTDTANMTRETTNEFEDRVVDNTRSANMTREASGEPDRITDNRDEFQRKFNAHRKETQDLQQREGIEGVQETPQGVDSQEIFGQGSQSSLGQESGPAVNLGEGLNVRSNGVQFESAPQQLEAEQTGQQALEELTEANIAESFTYGSERNQSEASMQSPEEDFRIISEGEPARFESHSELFETVLAHRLGILDNRVNTYLHSLNEKTREYLRYLAADKELMRLMLTSSPEIMAGASYPESVSPEKAGMARSFLKKIIEFPGKTKDAVIGMCKSVIEAGRDLAFAPIEKATGFLNKLVARRNQKREEYLKGAELRKGQLDEKQKEKLELAQQKLATARQLSDLITYQGR